ncbi:MAG: carboxypeptidase regulatory-like domain-containing protein [Myxococcales bacterium]|nr:carboxypeptidase regulatory-like domain-containing protein [Myxococcales bacterium]
MPSTFRLVLLAAALAGCGGGSSVTPRGHRTASDCERLVRHTIDALARENGAGAPTDEQRREIDALVDERCGDASYLAWVDDLPDASYGCLMRAQTMAEGDACMAALPAAAPAPTRPAPPAGPKCAAFDGDATGSATLMGVVTTADGAPFAGATVVATSGDQGELTAVTDSKGGYLFIDRTPGIYEITVYAGEQIIPHHCVSVPGADATTTVDVTIPAP